MSGSTLSPNPPPGWLAAWLAGVGEQVALSESARGGHEGHEHLVRGLITASCSLRANNSSPPAIRGASLCPPQPALSVSGWLCPFPPKVSLSQLLAAVARLVLSGEEKKGIWASRRLTDVIFTVYLHQGRVPYAAQRAAILGRAWPALRKLKPTYRVLEGALHHTVRIEVIRNGETRVIIHGVRTFILLCIRENALTTLQMTTPTGLSSTVLPSPSHHCTHQHSIRRPVSPSAGRAIR